MKNINYWVENTPCPEGIATQELPSKVDVAVVGSGYTGLNAAIELSKSGARRWYAIHRKAIWHAIGKIILAVVT
jgi:NADPH-dependent 2,4-dienoyl-CoA reductase/sulfur reductase-like enzyme